MNDPQEFTSAHVFNQQPVGSHQQLKEPLQQEREEVKRYKRMAEEADDPKEKKFWLNVAENTANRSERKEPKLHREHKRTHKAIADLRDKGYSMKQIAEMTTYSERTIYSLAIREPQVKPSTSRTVRKELSQATN